MRIANVSDIYTHLARLDQNYKILQVYLSRCV
ncbi:hypothetical protein GGD63_005813 [Bradyrhizobium sp. cir1]|nr:hypothetical protein [Bradyrhizobium sp. cir1]